MKKSLIAVVLTLFAVTCAFTAFAAETAPAKAETAAADAKAPADAGTDNTAKPADAKKAETPEKK